MFHQIFNKNALQPTLTTSSLPKFLVALAEDDEELLLGGTGGNMINTGTLKALVGNISVSTGEVLVNSRFYIELEKS